MYQTGNLAFTYKGKYLRLVMHLSIKHLYLSVLYLSTYNGGFISVSKAQEEG